MSYDIVYERVFITTPLGYVPLLLARIVTVPHCATGGG